MINTGWKNSFNDRIIISQNIYFNIIQLTNHITIIEILIILEIGY